MTRLPILMYHRVGTPPVGSKLADLWVSPDELQAQLGYLKAGGWSPMLFSELRKVLASGHPFPPKPILVTFDDGYANNYETGFPILKRLGVKAGIFLVHETMGRHNAWHDPAGEPWVPMMSLSQAREMQDSGLVEFGSHTMRHPRLTRVSLEEARWEIEESRRRLEKDLGREISAFAYPYGAGAKDEKLRALVRGAGYAFDFGTRPGATRLPWAFESGAFRRLFVPGGAPLWRFKLSLALEPWRP